MFFQIAFMSLSPYADKSLFFLRQGKTGDKIILVSDISAAHFFKYCFLHNRFHLSYRSLSIDFFLTDRCYQAHYNKLIFHFSCKIKEVLA